MLRQTIPRRVPIKLYIAGIQAPLLLISGVRWRQGIEISMSAPADHFISTSLQTTFSSVRLQNVTL